MKDKKAVIGFGVALFCFIAYMVAQYILGIQINQTVAEAVFQIVGVTGGFFGIYGIREQIGKYQANLPDVPKTSKTMWGFGIGLFVFAVRNILENAFGIVIPPGTWDIITQVIVYGAGLFGIYGVQDAIKNITYKS